MILVIDNYDSFTYNVVQALQRLSQEEVTVVRSREATVAELEALHPGRLVISPGPGAPADAGVSEEAIRHFAGKIPILGICLGHQAIGEAFGANIVQAKRICHGVVEEMKLDGRGLFRTVGKQASFTRYHSLVIEDGSLSADFEVTARSSDGDIMGIRHRTLFIEGVQFHPESIASQQGDEIFKAFLNYRRENLPAAAYLNQLLFEKKHLTREQAALFMDNLTDGDLDERVTAAMLTAMAGNGISADELAGCAEVLLKKKTPLPVAADGIAEIVGTGGDCKGSFNISSLSSIIIAACGQPVAKHGNRAVSSKSGAADFFEAIGIKIDNIPANTATLIEKTGFAFLMAPIFHPAMRFAAPVRKALGIKTIMNLLGPRCWESTALTCWKPTPMPQRTWGQSASWSSRARTDSTRFPPAHRPGCSRLTRTARNTATRSIPPTTASRTRPRRSLRAAARRRTPGLPLSCWKEGGGRPCAMRLP